MARHQLLADYIGETELAEEFGRHRTTIRGWALGLGLPYNKGGRLSDVPRANGEKLAHGAD
jgi:hypothetical protein